MGRMKDIQAVVEDYLKDDGYSQQDNANMVKHVSGLYNWIVQYDMKKFALNSYMLTCPRTVRAHEVGALHIHDLWTSIYMPYCSAFDLQDIIFNGLTLAKRAGPAKRLDSLINHIINFTVSAQQEVAGACAFTKFDTLLAPFVKKENLSYKRVKQEIQSFFFNINQPSRYGFQSPFLNLNVDIRVPELFKGIQPIIGGEAQSFTYDDVQNEMDMINHAICEIHMEGDYDRAPFTFPIITVQVNKDTNWKSDPIIEKYIILSSRRGQPYWLNYNLDYLDENNSLSMCCRLRVDYDDLKMHAGGIFTPVTGSIGVVTLNMPRVGYTSLSMNDIYNKVDILLDMARKQLNAKRMFIDRSMKKGLLPCLSHHLKRGFKLHYNTIGIVGMHDFCMNYLEQPIWTYDSQLLINRVLDHINRRLEEFQREDKVLWNLEQTPAERTAGRLAYHDKRKYKNIYVSINEPGAEQYTNSTHLPVEYESLFNKIEIEGKFQRRFTGGAVTHLFLDEISNPRGLIRLANRIVEKTDLGYFSFTPTLSHCSKCRKVIVGNFITCPNCKGWMEVYSRIVGYYRPVSSWNPSKKEEFYRRRLFNV